MCYSYKTKVKAAASLRILQNVEFLILTDSEIYGIRDNYAPDHFQNLTTSPLVHIPTF